MGTFISLSKWQILLKNCHINVTNTELSTLIIAEYSLIGYNFHAMNDIKGIPPIRMAEVFHNGHCVGFLSDVKLSEDAEGGYELEGDWTGYPDALKQDGTFTISVPRREYKFLADQVETGPVTHSGRIKFEGASLIPDGPSFWDLTAE